MRVFIFTVFLSLLIFSIVKTTQAKEKPYAPTSECRQLYLDMNLDGIVDYMAFVQAVAGLNSVGSECKGIITLIDFTKPSTEKRLYVLDLRHKKMLFHTHVSHGQNSGENFATSFSNSVGSHKSSLGFFVTGNTYIGRNGYSLLLNGLEKGINDRARERSIVIHGADYSDPAKIPSAGRLGRSFGCPALPPALSEPIINTIKDGTLLYIYANNGDYLRRSSVISSSLAYK